MMLDRLKAPEHDHLLVSEAALRPTVTGPRSRRRERVLTSDAR
jgi:hypothetical protein